MSLVSIKNGELELFKRILKDGYAIGDGSETKRIIRELKHAQIPVHHGYDSDTKKVIVALKSPIKAIRKQRDLAKTIFDIEK